MIPCSAPGFDWRLDEKIEPDANLSCWLWTGATTMAGYAQFGRRGIDKPKSRLVHRYVYEFFKGQIPEGMEINHLCHTRACQNPNHMEAVTHAENMRKRSGIRKTRALKANCKRGHVLDSANRRGNRCRICHNAAQVEYTKRKRDGLGT